MAAFLADFDKPAASRRRFISRYGRGLSGVCFDFEAVQLRKACRYRRAKMQFYRLAETGQCLLYSIATAIVEFVL